MIKFGIYGSVSSAVKPNLQVLRARFSEITPHAVRAACENLTEPDQRVSDAVDVRQELDLRIGEEPHGGCPAPKGTLVFSYGANTALWFIASLFPSFLRPSFPGAAFTRFQTLRLQRIFPEVLAEQLISYGSCQFPTLGFVVERFKAIQAFVPEVFHKIKGRAQGFYCRVYVPQEDQGVQSLSKGMVIVLPCCLSPAHMQNTERALCVQTPLFFHPVIPFFICHGFSETTSVCLQ